MPPPQGVVRFSPGSAFTLSTASLGSEKLGGARPVGSQSILVPVPLDAPVWLSGAEEGLFTPLAPADPPGGGRDNAGLC